MCSQYADSKAQEKKIVIRQRDSKDTQRDKRGLRKRLSTDLELHLQNSPSCVLTVSPASVYMLRHTQRRSTSMSKEKDCSVFDHVERFCIL